VQARRAPRRVMLNSLRRGLCTSTTQSICREWTPASRRVGAIGMKCGMTQAWSSSGKLMPICVVELQDLTVTKVRRAEVEGVSALQLAGGWQKRKRMRLTEAALFEKRGLPYKSYMREFNVTPDALLPVGTSITARHFVPGQYVDVQAVSKGKGFAGVMKRHGFKGQPATHGVSKTHRGIGSMGGAAGSMYGTKVRKGKKMPGRMGGKRVTMRNLMVHNVDPTYNLLYLKGTVPGAKGSVVRLRDAALSRHSVARVLSSPPPFPTFLPEDQDASAEEGGSTEPVSLSRGV